MISIQLPLFPELVTGTSATGLIHKGFLPGQSGTCSGTHVEQSNAAKGVPHAKVEQEHKRNRNKRYKTMAYDVCSGVPVVKPDFVSLFNFESDAVEESS